MRRIGLRHRMDVRTLLVVGALGLSATAGAAQEAGRDSAEVGGSAAVSPDSANVIRASLVRPPRKPKFDVVDAVALPFRILFFPLRLVGLGGAELIGRLAKTPEPPTPLDRIRQEGVYPALGTIGPRSGTALQVRFDRFSPAFVDAAFSIRASQRYRVGLLFQRGPDLLEISYTFQRNAQPFFWGIGPDTRPEDETQYGWDRQFVAALASKTIDRLVLSGQLAWEDNRVRDGNNRNVDNLVDQPGSSELYGVTERVEYARLNLGAAFDLTHLRGLQQRGLFIQAGVSIFRGVADTDSDFHQFDLTLRGYGPINPRQQLVFQILSTLTRNDGGEGAPFYHLASMGSRLGARSLHQDRFRDFDMLALMLEWRFEVWRELHERSRVESFVFFDNGGVEDRVTHFRLSDFRQSFGFGMRAVALPRAFFVTYMAFGDEGPRFHVSFGTSF